MNVATSRHKPWSRFIVQDWYSWLWVAPKIVITSQENIKNDRSISAMTSHCRGIAVIFAVLILSDVVHAATKKVETGKTPSKQAGSLESVRRYIQDLSWLFLHILGIPSSNADKSYVGIWGQPFQEKACMLTRRHQYLISWIRQLALQKWVLCSWWVVLNTSGWIRGIDDELGRKNSNASGSASFFSPEPLQ